MKLIADNTIKNVAQYFAAPTFTIDPFDKQAQYLTQSADILLCRAHKKIDAAFLHQHRPKVVATASSGSDHIDKQFLQKYDIPWFDAKGANAQAVCDYVLHLLFHPKFPIKKPKVGIIGVGFVGQALKNALKNLGIPCVCYDPPRAMREANFVSDDLQAVYECNVISLHVPLITTGADATHHLINEKFLSNLQANSVVINASRGGVLQESVMPLFPNLHFCLDVFETEPFIRPEVIKNCLFATPHIAGHSIEAKARCLSWLYQKVSEHFGLAPDKHISMERAIRYQRDQLKFEYDPYLDTCKLKAQPDSNQFQYLRNHHTFRHELFSEGRQASSVEKTV
jgi:erythronate-4-phosphate dehydrogenase